MPEASIFRWLDGNGWLMFSGGPDDDVRAVAIHRAAADGAVAVLHLGGEGEALLFDLQDLGAPAGYVVDPVADNDPTLLDKLSNASVVIVTGAETTKEARTALLGAPLEGIQAAYDQGAVILVEGAAVGLFGGWSLEDTLREGLDWVEGVALMTQGVPETLAMRLLAETPAAIVVNIRPGSGIAFAADGAVDLLGLREVVVRLGSAYTSR